jgi:hypothetical protein
MKICLQQFQLNFLASTGKRHRIRKIRVTGFACEDSHPCRSSQVDNIKMILCAREMVHQTRFAVLNAARCFESSSGVEAMHRVEYRQH